MTSEKFQAKCRALVLDYANEHLDKSDHIQPITLDGVYVVWYGKVLQNHKALLSTALPDGMYYELTYNGDRCELYFDAYKKWENCCIKEVF